jgi:hypothetical protein
VQTERLPDNLTRCIDGQIIDRSGVPPRGFLGLPYFYFLSVLIPTLSHPGIRVARWSGGGGAETGDDHEGNGEMI